jgi:hypothetical protein
MSQVSGKVLYKDGSVPRGGVCVVNFQPATNSTAEVRKGASGAIGSDGAFEMWTRMPGDGVYHGEYNVAFVILKGPSDPTPLVQPKYANARTSGYEVTVDDDISDLKFEIEPLPGVTGAPATAAGG